MTLCAAPWAGGIDVDVHVQPRSSKESVGGVHGGALRVRVHAPPAAGEASAAVCAAIARALGVRRDAVELRAGPRSRRKRVRIAGDPDVLLARLAALEQRETPV